jgi:hypothetical protein
MKTLLKVVCIRRGLDYDTILAEVISKALSTRFAFKWISYTEVFNTICQKKINELKKN